MTAYTVTSGATSSGLVLRNGDELDVLSGGVAVLTVVSSGGTAFVYNGGVANFTVVSNGGAAFVYNGGFASGTEINGGGTEYVYNGGTAGGSVINSGGAEMVLSGGSANFTVISGGVQVVNTGGTASFAVVSGGGTQTVSGGVASGTTLAGGTQTVTSGGIASGTIVGSGGTETVASGGIARFTTIASGGTETVAGGNASATTVNGGLLIVTAGGVATATIVNSGGTEFVADGGIGRNTVVGSGGTEYIFTGGVASGTAVRSGGSEIVEFGGTADFTVVSGGTAFVTYGGTASGMVLRDGAHQYVYSGGNVIDTVVSSGGVETIYAGEIVFGTRLTLGGAIDLPDFAYGGGLAGLDALTGVLTVSGGGGLYEQTLSGVYTNLYFHTVPGSGTGTLITLNSTPQCFLSGTRIATDRGQTLVELLEIGDRVLLHDGHAASIVWIGHRHVDASRHPHPELVWPVRVTAHAFGPGLPRRDLFLSPDHAVFVDTVLIPIKYLIDGTSIAQVKREDVTYHHVELAAHDLLLAEGLPVESYLDTGDRSRFDNNEGPVTLHPDFQARIRDAMGCAKLVITGPELAAVRARLEEGEAGSTHASGRPSSRHGPARPGHDGRTGGHIDAATFGRRLSDRDAA